ncbi:MAG TPA: flagellar biosynthesis anti-sigma factor FlgM [Methylomirabilota bacterium]|jgi:negative regulator of flagellin synthesis FlgM|nr:flagellar biosynthesis anti-sigma factor FlgM [Methylomirabilota bacterium]
MKIDPKLPANGELQSDRVKNSAGAGVPAQGQAKSAGTTAAKTEDTFQPSGRGAEVQKLAAQAATLPDVRAEKVAPLQAKVESGLYNPDSKRVADALIADESGKASKR